MKIFTTPHLPSRYIKQFLYTAFIFLLFLVFNPIKILGQSDSLFTPAASFTNDSHIISTAFFHWFTSDGGQLSGPWVPVEGRENWTGLPDWWKTQIKQVMMANINVINVHLIDQSEILRVFLFRALHELRAEGYDVPKVVPFLDPLITWYEEPMIDLATEAGKDTLAAQYIRFYNQYFSENDDIYASDYIGRIDNRPVLDIWHAHINCLNVTSLERSDLTDRLNAAFGSEYDVFKNPVYMITTALNPPQFTFADEKVPQFEINEYYYEVNYNNLKTVQLKAGYWDQNIRTPGDFLPRDGGTHYIDAWQMINSDVNRIYVESWNEYDEGTGIYAASTGPPYIKPGSNNPNTDVWSNAGDPNEYIHTTANGASIFNDYPPVDALILAQDLPDKMDEGSIIERNITIRNSGNESWTGAAGFHLAQSMDDDYMFMTDGGQINDTSNEIPLYGGIFRGRPVTFHISLKAPDQTGQYQTHWQMMKGDQPFGEMITHTITVEKSNSIPEKAAGIGIKLFPNPANGPIHCEWNKKYGSANLAVYNLLGEEVYQKSSLNSKETIYLNLSAGLYQVILTNDNFSCSRLLIINNH